MKIPSILLILLAMMTPCFGQEFHLTARAWQPLNIPREAYLDSIEGICRFTAKHLGPDGEVIDPILKREHQYSTPYFAFAVGLLVHEGRCRDLLSDGVRAMDHATACFAKGSAGSAHQPRGIFLPSS